MTISDRVFRGRGGGGGGGVNNRFRDEMHLIVRFCYLQSGNVLISKLCSAKMRRFHNLCIFAVVRLYMIDVNHARIQKVLPEGIEL